MHNKKNYGIVLLIFLLSLTFPLNGGAKSNSKSEYLGYLKNDAKVHQAPNGNSKIIIVAHTPIKSGNVDNGENSRTSIPEISNQKINGMYRIKYNQKVGYVDQDNYTVRSNSDNNQGFYHYDRAHLSGLLRDTKNPNYQVPNFKGMNIQDVKSAQNNGLQEVYGKDGQMIVNNRTKKPGERTSTQLDVWDSWPLQNADDTVTNFHGYHVVFALAGNYNQFKKGRSGVSYAPEAKIYMFYQKIGDPNTGTSSWHSAGPIFKNNFDGANENDSYLKHQTQEWSGSTYNLDNDDSVRLFYTDFSGDKRINGTGNNNQVLSTAKLYLSANDNGVSIDQSKTTDHHSIYTGEGVYYQGENQFYKEWPDNWQYDDMAMRDPHLVINNGQKYLVFEGNTGVNSGYQGMDNLYNMNYFGGSHKFQRKEQQKLFDDKRRYQASQRMNKVANQAQADQKDVQKLQKIINKRPNDKTLQKQFNKAKSKADKSQGLVAYNGNPGNIKAEYANAALGIIKLNNNFTLSNVYKPIIGFNSVNDETERPDMFEHNGKWYVFTITRGARIGSYNVNQYGIYMWGFVGNSPQGPFKPLNKNGLVLSSNDLNPNSRTFNYSYYAIPSNNPNDNQVLITDYMTNTGNPKANGGYSTFGPSFKLDLKGDQTKVVKNSTLPQGTVDPNEKK